MNILIVEDEFLVALEIESFLKQQNLNVLAIVSNAKDAISIIKEQRVDLVLMDIYLEGEIDGIEATKIIHSINSFIQIIFLSANSDRLNIDRAIESNPITYLSKPFNREELYAAITLAKKKIHHIIHLDKEFSYDKKSHILYYKNEIVSLSQKESQLLTLFINNLNNLVTNYMIENEIWPQKDANASAIRTLIKRLRAKLKHKFITTLTSQGYIFHIE